MHQKDFVEKEHDLGGVCERSWLLVSSNEDERRTSGGGLWKGAKVDCRGERRVFPQNVVLLENGPGERKVTEG